MVHLDKVFGTLIVWVGIVGLSYLFNKWGILSGQGAGLMVAGAIVVTNTIWKLNIL